MDGSVLGVHHVTAIASDPQRNVDFYAGLLGLRLVKVTVNFDDPSSYHFYYGDALGHPGTLLTFFAWPGGLRGRRGTGQIAATTFTIPEAALDYWTERLSQQGVRYDGPVTRFGAPTLAFHDPDGLALELVAHEDGARRPGWDRGPVPAEHAIRGVHAVTLWEHDPAATTVLLSETMGFRREGKDGDITRYAVGEGLPGALVDVRAASSVERGHVAVGSVHHVAWRTPTDDEQLAWRERLAALGLHVTPVMDRQYFKSIYFREPGGVLFEIATDPPGFATDETPAELGTHLKLPPWLEPHRAALQQELPPLRLPDVSAAPQT